ncbi:MAG: DUF4112 domain-containing protein [Bernardetiaceae bacterium]|nr:DUF4112 domain-containing protein [Bernardetiaceae bacterium]
METRDKKQLPVELRTIEILSKVLDSTFRVPFTSFKFGIDPILGFVPIIGDLVSFAISLFIIWTVYKHKASTMLIVLMLKNIFVDLIMGSVPLVGNIADFMHRANSKNLKLIHEYHYENKHQKGGKTLLIGLLVFIILTIIAMFYLLWYLWQMII